VCEFLNNVCVQFLVHTCLSELQRTLSGKQMYILYEDF